MKGYFLQFGCQGHNFLRIELSGLLLVLWWRARAVFCNYNGDPFHPPSALQPANNAPSGGGGEGGEVEGREGGRGQKATKAAAL